MNTLKTIAFLAISIFFVIACETNTTTSELDEISLSSTSENAKHANTFDVRIELVDRNGNPVGPNGLRGYFAIDQETGETFYPFRSEDHNVFKGLPQATYRFDAHDGYFDGASSQIVTLQQNMVASDGFIVVTLQYWSE
ncbi:hypothetical protein [Aquimarina algicola]|uniref:Carboxypeptidase regulatory-like domain-containing protein n=1 Tax=Aquimarina algicola TaxID=2589995 RepID=A0A504JBA9_9FLAO|nr:hypothetical protein [Aquimarina algicola]TPN85148.1 hypothetical protein FHK87_14040 [Aquimarina algicola]